MSTAEAVGKPARALEITASLSARRFGLCGFDTAEAQRVSKILLETNSLAMFFDERLLSDYSRVCDAILVKLSSLGPEGLRAAASSPAPVLVIGSCRELLAGAGAAYGWPRDFMTEPWSEAELIVRLFRLVGAVDNSRWAASRQTRTDPVVLLADDDPEWVVLVDATLRGDGMQCQVANDGLAALRLARELIPDLMLLDVRMPGMNGFEVLDTIRHDPALEPVPVILLTACDDSADILRGSALHADEYVGKPVRPYVLLNRVKRLLSTHSRRGPRWARVLPPSPGAGGSGQRWVSNRSLPPRTGEHL